MNHFIKYFSLIIFFFYSCQSTGHNDTKQLISEGLLKEDFKVFQKTIEEAHPGLYWYTDKKEMDAFFDSLFHKIDGSMDDEGFFKLLLPTVGKVKCVHTQIHLSENTQRRLFSRVKILPINIAVIQGKVFVTESFGNLPPAGTELTNINGIPIDQILKKMMEIIPSDGFNTSHKYHALKTGFREAYGLLYGQPDTFNITGKDSSQRLIQYILMAKSPDQLKPPSLTDTIPIKYEYINDNKIAHLSIKTFNLSSGFFNERMNTFFSEIEENKINKLIIDIRNNEGGNNTNVTTLFSYLARRPFLHLKKTEMKTRTLTYSNHVSNFSQFKNIRATKTSDGTYEVDHIYSGRNLRHATQHAFAGNLIVLANGGTVSAASEFVALVRGYERGIAVGEEAGGCYYGATGGNYLNLVLPHSGIRVTIPIVKILTGVPEDLKKQPRGRGVIPEFMIIPTVSDLINHTDPELKAAINILSS